VFASLSVRFCVCISLGAGVEIGTHVNDCNLDDPTLFPVFEECEKLGAAVLIHPWDMMGMKKMPRYWLPWFVVMFTRVLTVSFEVKA
jgi:aminocarboxymuconate-semialdehyde decarboxylase